MTILTRTDYKTLLFPDHSKASFYLSFQDFAKEFGCFYVSYLFEDKIKNIRVGFGSNPDWQTQFITHNLMNDCHLVKQGIKNAINTNRIFTIYPWENASPTSSKEKDVIIYRSEFGIGANGISFLTIKNNKMESLAFAPEINNPRFTKYVTQNIKLIQEHIKVFRLATNNILAGYSAAGTNND